MNQSHKYFYIFSVFLFYFFTPNVYAWECTRLTSQYIISTPAKIVLQRDVPVGQALSEWLSSTGPQDLHSCTTTGIGGANWNIRETSIAPQTNQTYTDGKVKYKIYKTNIDGIGIAIRAKSKAFSSNYSSYYNFPYGQWQPGYYSTPFTTTFQADARFIKTGPTTGGALSQTLIGNLRAFGESGKFYYPVNVYVNPSNIHVLACSINTPVVNVKFDKYKKDKFKSINYKTPSIPVPFTLNCNAGTNVNVTIHANKDTSLAENGLIKITSGDNATSGLAVQITDKNENGIMIGNTFKSGTSNREGTYDLGLRARLVQTSTKVTPGKINAVATVEMTYN